MGNLLPLVVEKRSPHRLGVFCPKLEDVTDLDPLVDDHRRPAPGAGIARDGVTQVKDPVEGKVASGDDAGEMDINLVPANDDARHGGDRVVDDEGDLQTNRAEEAQGGAGGFFDRGGIGGGDGTAPERPANLGFVGFVVASDQSGDWLVVDEKDEEFSRGCFIDLEEVANLDDCPPVWCGDGRVGGSRRGVGRGGHFPGGGLTDLGSFLVGGVLAGGALDDGVFAGGGGDHELVRAVAADGAGFGFDDGVGDAATVEDPAIRLVHRVVAGAKLVDIGVEAVGVLHQELAGPQDPEAGAGFIAKLGLDLVERDRQLLVRPNEGRARCPVQTSSWVGPRAKCCFELVVSCMSSSPNVSYRPDSFQSSIG